jgi:DNA-binding MarR family transcriptional regulator
VESTLEKLFSRLTRLRRRYLESRLKDTGVTPGQPAVLAALEESPGLSQKGLARAIGVQPPTATRLVQRLVESGMVVRKPDRNDRRSTRLFLTDAGFSISQGLQSVRMDEERLVRSVVSETETEQLVGLLTRVCERYRSAADAPAEIGTSSPVLPSPTL